MSKIGTAIRRVKNVSYHYKNSSQKIGSIAKWYVKTHTECVDGIKDIANMLDENTKKERKKREIVFIVGHPSPRCEKIMRALQNEGIIVHVLYNSIIPKTKVTNDFKAIADSYQEYQCVEELMYYLIMSNAAIAHYFSEWIDCRNGIVLLSCKEILPQIVVERYDIRTGMEIPKSYKCKLEQRLEIKMLEKADAICAREYGMEYLRSVLHYHITDRSIVFLDNIGETVTSRENEKLEELSICYIGGFFMKGNSRLNVIPDLIKLCQDNNCHFHFYPSYYDENVISFFEPYSNPYFHLHKTLNNEELIYEIAKYDYGIHPAHEMNSRYKIDDLLSNEKYIYGATNKYFDYLAAGIPIIGGTLERQLDELESGGFVLRRTLEEIDFNELKEKKTYLRKKVLENRSKWFIQNQIGRLISFYNDVSDARNKLL